MQTDIEIAQSAQLAPISSVYSQFSCAESIDQDLIPYGQHIAKISPVAQQQIKNRADGKLILVTAMSPTPAGEGKTTTTIGLADALNQLFKDVPDQAMVCIREPSLGPVFGIKGGAAGGGYAQVVPMEQINLHFTGDFHAITSANNLLAALIDNHLYHGNALNIDPDRISWQRCLDMNDRALRDVTLNTKNKAKSNTNRDTGFDISVASEVMAIFCLADSLADLTKRLGRIQVAWDKAGKPVYAADLNAQGAMTALLKDAFQPNLVQTLEQTPAIVHGGPFANIAHGCNSVTATKTALKLADYVVTEAGFGADLGAQKFLDIKCQQAGLAPDAVVVVATIRALKYHGGVAVSNLNNENVEALLKGINNLKRHINNLHEVYGQSVVVAINQFNADAAAEIEALTTEVKAMGIDVCLCNHWAQGGTGALALAKTVVALCDQPAPLQPVSMAEDSVEDKIAAIATKLYGASGVEYSDVAKAKLTDFAAYPDDAPVHLYPVCIAKTQYSFSSDAKALGAPSGHVLQVRDLKLSNGAGFIVVICGAVMTMPGLPMTPASEHIGVDKNGMITGLS